MYCGAEIMHVWNALTDITTYLLIHNATTIYTHSTCLSIVVMSLCVYPWTCILVGCGYVGVSVHRRVTDSTPLVEGTGDKIRGIHHMEVFDRPMQDEANYVSLKSQELYTSGQLELIVKVVIVYVYVT